MPFKADMQPKISVVILNYNGKGWLEKFLPNVIEHSTYPNAEIIVADNASTDDSMAFMASHHLAIRVIQNQQNNGYAGGYNKALKQIKSDYYVLLNSDVEVTPGWIENVMDFMLKDPLMAACQPKILSYSDKSYFEYAGAAGGFIDKYGYPFCRGRIFDTNERDEGQYNQSCEIFWASGACLFVRADLYHSTGGLDEDFFAHMEEIDLCWRLKNLGYKIGYCAESVVYHVGGGTLHKSNPRKTFLNFLNNRSLLHKNLSKQSLQSISIIRNLLDWIAWLKILLKDSKEADAIKNALKDYRASKQSLDAKRQANEAMEKSISIGSPNTSGIYNGSIVWNYFICKIKAFSKLPISKFSNYPS
ncbi:MAG: glycosyltransferase family 2 protein [Chitinophagales bacterium]